MTAGYPNVHTLSVRQSQNIWKVNYTAKKNDLAASASERTGRELGVIVRQAIAKCAAIDQRIDAVMKRLGRFDKDNTGSELSRKLSRC